MRWGKRHHTLEEYDLADFDDLEIMQSGSRNMRKGLPPSGRGTGEGLKTLGDMQTCFCGLPFQHDWPGKADGVPHP